LIALSHESVAATAEAPRFSPGYRAAWRIVTSLVLAALLLGFAYSNFQRWRQTGEPVGLGITAMETLAAILFIVRRQPRETSTQPVAWLAAAVATFVTLFARPIAHPNGGPGEIFEIVQLVGLAIAVSSLGVLGRSFGIVAANRGIKTAGMYRVVRHPMYLGSTITFVGYAAENPSVMNIALLVTAVASQLIRIVEEEKTLHEDEGYRRYQAAVRYRLIPGLF
jgi:protein-S-isoprenylcysteine O-methyltransferase Ste14